MHTLSIYLFKLWNLDLHVLYCLLPHCKQMETNLSLLEILSFTTCHYVSTCNQMSPTTRNGCLCNYFSNLDEIWSSFQLGYDYDLFHP
jgi:hypothetical protein